MSQIVYYVAASLDGYIADADGGVGWLPEGNADDYSYADFYAGVDALVMGRRTYDQVLGFGEWPYIGKPAYVFTNNPPDDNPHGVEFVSASPTEFAQSVAARYPGVVWLVGGGNLAEQFRLAGLIDEYLVHVIPVILGSGIPLTSPRHFTFPGHSGESRNPPPTRLELVESQSYGAGVVMLRYLPRPPLDSGSSLPRARYGGRNDGCRG